MRQIFVFLIQTILLFFQQDIKIIIDEFFKSLHILFKNLMICMYLHADISMFFAMKHIENILIYLDIFLNIFSHI